MKYIDYYVYKIYKTYRWLHKVAPGLVWDGPLPQAAMIAAMYPSLLLFSISLYLGIWRTDELMVWQFVWLFFNVLIYVFFGLYLKSRITKAYARYHKETRNQSIRGALLVNIIIILCILIVGLSLIY